MDDAQRQIDTRAIEIAGQALQKIDSHEQVCTVRQGQIMDKLNSLHLTMGWAMRGLIFLLLSIIGYFLIHGGIPQAKAHGDAQWIQEGKYVGLTGVQCCGPTDCEIIAEREIKRTIEGWEVEGVLFRDSDYGRGLHASEAHDFWICRLSPDDESDGPGHHHIHSTTPPKPHCLFVRMEGV